MIDWPAQTALESVIAALDCQRFRTWYFEIRAATVQRIDSAITYG